MADQRNFRSSYLEKVGIKGVEEKKSLEILLKEQPIDRNKLEQFCLRFPVPATYRPYLWKVMLGVLPPYLEHVEASDFVYRQRQEQYGDLEQALTVMRRINEHTPLPEAHLRMLLIEEGALPFEERNMMQEPCHLSFLSMSGAMSEVVEEHVDIYWLTTSFYRLHQKHKENASAMVDKVEQCLKKEDTDGKLLHHLHDLKAFHLLPFQRWFDSCFSSVLPGKSFERIWDKIIGGSSKIGIYVAVAILLTFRRYLLGAKTIDGIVDYLAKIPEDTGDIIVTLAIDLWQNHGGL